MKNGTFAAIEHVAGAAACAAVLLFTSRIVQAGSAAASWLIDRLASDGTVAFMEFDVQAPVSGMLLAIVVVGIGIASFDFLVRRGLLRPWVPPLAVFGLTCSALTLALAPSETGWRGAATVGTGLGLVLASAFAAWWFTSRAIRRLRGQVAGDVQ